MPITVVQPITLNISETNIYNYPLGTYKAATLNRVFFDVPSKATWAVLRLRSPNTSSHIPAKFLVHTMQLLPQRYCKALETEKILSISGESITTHAFKCQVRLVKV